MKTYFLLALFTFAMAGCKKNDQVANSTNSTPTTYSYTVNANQHTLILDNSASTQLPVTLPAGTYTVSTSFSNPQAGGNLDGVFFVAYPGDTAYQNSFNQTNSTLTFSNAVNSGALASLFYIDRANLGDDYGSIIVTFTNQSTNATYTFKADAAKHTTILDASSNNQVRVTLPAGTYDITTTFNSPQAGGNLNGVFFVAYPGGTAYHHSFNKGVTSTLTFPSAIDSNALASLFFVDRANIRDDYGSVTVTFTKR